MTGAGRLGLGAALLMTLAACAGGEDGPDFGKLTTVVVGQSSRADVLGAMGRPSQVLRTAKGRPGFTRRGAAATARAWRLRGRKPRRRWRAR